MFYFYADLFLQRQLNLKIDMAQAIPIQRTWQRIFLGLEATPFRLPMVGWLALSDDNM